MYRVTHYFQFVYGVELGGEVPRSSCAVIFLLPLARLVLVLVLVLVDDEFEPSAILVYARYWTVTLSNTATFLCR